MGWLTIDDFESGSLGGDWSGDTGVFIVHPDTTLNGSYLLALDTNDPQYVPNSIFKLINTQNVSRNSLGDFTARILVDGPGSVGIILFYQDENNYYKIYRLIGKQLTTLTIDKVVDGVKTELVWEENSCNSMEIKAETNLITVYAYREKNFTDLVSITTTSDTTFSSGKIGVFVESDWEVDQGITTNYLDDIEYWEEEGSPATNSSATNYPGTMADDATVGTQSWSNIDNIKVSDDSYADADISGIGVVSHYAKATNFGFSIPIGATIDGILVEVERGRQSETNTANDNGIRIVKSTGAIGSENKTSGMDWSTEQYISYGGSSDLWSETWTAEDINDIDFGAVVSAASPFASNCHPRIDNIRITVTYTEPSTQISKVKIGGTFVEKPAMVKIGGTFVEKIMKVRVGGVFQ